MFEQKPGLEREDDKIQQWKCKMSPIQHGKLCKQTEKNNLIPDEKSMETNAERHKR